MLLWLMVVSMVDDATVDEATFTPMLSTTICICPHLGSMFEDLTVDNVLVIRIVERLQRIAYYAQRPRLSSSFAPLRREASPMPRRGLLLLQLHKPLFYFFANK